MSESLEWRSSRLKESSKACPAHRDDSRSPDATYRNRRDGRGYAERDGRDRHDQRRRDRDYDSEQRSRRRRDSSDSLASRDRSHHRRDRSRSPPPKRRRHSETLSRSPPPAQRSRAPLPSQNDSFRGSRGDVVAAGEGLPPVQKEKPNYKPTGLLAKEANTVAGTRTVLKYHEPPEARKPPSKEQWRMYVFKDKDLLDTVYLYSRSAWLLGRDEKVTDYLLEHPSVSKQHAVIQFRHRQSTNEYGDKTNKVKPYLIDLESANGTRLNGKKIEASRYVELIDGDVIGFGDGEREYVMMLPPAGT